MTRIRFVNHADDRELGIAELDGGRLIADRPSVQEVIDGKVLGLDLSGPQATEYFAAWSNGGIGSRIVTGTEDDGGYEALVNRPTTTVGVDLAAATLGTAVVAIDWAATTVGTRLVSDPSSAVDGVDTILTTLAQDDRVGIDCPFGWPEGFVDAVSTHRNRDAWPTGPDLDDRRELRLRATDRHVESTYGLHPLSVSADKIGSVAMRWAALLTRHERTHGPTDRTGGGRLVEVYPALALHVWRCAGEEPRIADYKKKSDEGVAARSLLLDLLERRVDPLQVDDGVRRAAAHRRYGADVVDALVAALVAAAAATPECVEDGPDDSDDRRRAQSEGWIAIPTEASLSQFAPLRGPWFARSRRP